MKNKLKISECDVIYAIFRPMAKTSQQPWKIASNLRILVCLWN